jgi:hypothetical protein
VNTGGPTFPIHRPAVPEGTVYAASMVVDDGMALRDYFAAKAMQAIVSNGDVDPQKISQASYIIADGMLKARNP